MRVAPPQPNMSDPLQHVYQLLQRTRIEPAPHFHSPPAAQYHRQRAARRGDGSRCPPGHLHGQQCVAASRCLSVPSSPVPGERAQPHSPLPAELAPVQPARFKLCNQLLDLMPAPPAPPFTHLLFIHAPTSSPNPSVEQMVSSDAYEQVHCLLSSARRFPAARRGRQG